MYRNQTTGKTGENIATDYLIKKGYEIIERNFRCKSGEIDIIAKEKNEIVFVEVKTRTKNLYGEPAEAVDNRKKNHIYKVAKVYLYFHHKLDNFVRIDVIEVYLNESGYKINHIKKAVIKI